MATTPMDKASLHPARSRWIELWNGKQALGWDHHGTPVFRFKWAPGALATRRQLRAMRMCPGGQEPYALLVWRNGQRWALALPPRPRQAVPRRLTGPAQRPRQGDGSTAPLQALRSPRRLLHPHL